jgi:hypothetical protein
MPRGWLRDSFELSSRKSTAITMSHDAVIYGVIQQFNQRAKVEFPHNAGAMYLNRPDRYAELAGYLLVRFCLRQKLNDLNFTRSR